VIASSSCSVMAVRSGDLFGDDMKNISAVTCLLPPSNLTARSTSSFYKRHAKNFFASAHPPATSRRSWRNQSATGDVLKSIYSCRRRPHVLLIAYPTRRACTERRPVADHRRPCACGRPGTDLRSCMLKMTHSACSFGWCLMASADLF
jgi:hypothetical protein